MVPLLLLLLLPSGGGLLAQAESPSVGLVIPDPVSPRFHGGAPNVVQVAATSGTNTIQTVESQLLATGTASSIDALEIFAQDPPVLTPATATATSDNTAFPPETPAGTTILFIVEGVVAAIDAANGEWQIGDQPVIVYESLTTVVGGAPVVGDLVTAVGHRTLDPGPIVAERISLLARAPQAPGPAALTTALRFHGTVTAAGATSWTVAPTTVPAPSASFSILLDAGPLGLGPTIIDLGLGFGSAVTVEFAVSSAAGGLGAPVLGAHEIFAQEPLPSIAPTAAVHVSDQTAPVSFQAPAGSIITFDIAGVVSAIDLARSEWQIGTQSLFVYESAATTRTGFDTDPAVGDEVLVTASRSAPPGPLVAEIIELKNSGRQQEAATITPQTDGFLINGTVSAITTTQWTIGGMVFDLIPANDPLGLGPTRIDLGLDVGSAVGVEFAMFGDLPPQPVLWQTHTFNAASGLWEAVVNAEAVAVDTAALLYIRATDAAGGSTTSVLSATLRAVALAVPAAPANLTATGISPTRTDLQWTDASANESVFRIERSTDGFLTVEKSEIVPADVTSFSDMTVVLGNTYSYRVFATNGAGDSVASGVVVVAAGAPLAPGSLVASATGATTVSLSWQDNSTDETGFLIERATGGGAFTAVGTVGAGITAFADSGLTAGTTYQYRVVAFNASGDSVASGVVVVTLGVLLAPGSLVATATGQSTVSLSWQDNSTDETGFRIERATGGGAFTTAGTVAADIAAFIQCVHNDLR